MKRNVAIIVLSMMVLFACDDTTDTMGIINNDSDKIETDYKNFNVYSNSLKADSVLSSSNNVFFGRITDPETNMPVTSEFIAQFCTLENYELPRKENMVLNENGEIEADSIEIRFYYKNYIGDDTNPLKVNIYELDTTHVMREDSFYYSNADYSKYFNPKASGPIAQKMFTVKDLIQSDETLGSSSYIPNMRVLLPKEYGSHILNKYYENPDFFRNSYNFIHHVCPGFYFSLADGDGTMVELQLGALNVYFKYKDVERDTVYVGLSRFAATPEVFQRTHIKNEGIDELVHDAQNSDYTYLKTPSGIFTELTLPIDEIYQGHEKDSISQAQITLFRHNYTSDSHDLLTIPENLLMIHKSEIYSFFEQHKTTDGKTAFVTSFNKNYNTYSYSNIGNMISYCRQYKESKSKEAGIDKETWAMNHPEWNKVVLIPVYVTKDNSNNILSINNDLRVASTRLVRGTDANPIKMEVIYSSFQ